MACFQEKGSMFSPSAGIALTDRILCDIFVEILLNIGVTI